MNDGTLIDEKFKNQLTDRMVFEYEKLWKYFEYHASQRIIVFRFFVIMAGLVSSVFISLLYISSSKASNCTAHSCLILPKLLWVMLALGLILLVLCFTFWNLDKRNNIMINESRTSLEKMEEFEEIKYPIFKNVDNATIKYGGLRFHHCFNIIFITFAVIGLIIAVYSICHIFNN